MGGELGPSAGKPRQTHPNAGTLATMTREASNMVWAVGLILAALVLGKADSNAIPWAVAALGITVLVGAVIAYLVERDHQITASHAASRNTTSTPGATDTP